MLHGHQYRFTTLIVYSVRPEFSCGSAQEEVRKLQDLLGALASRRWLIGMTLIRSERSSRPGYSLDYAPRRRFASCRTSSLSILYFKVLSGIPRYSAVAVTFHPHFSSARRMKLRSNVFVACSKSLSVCWPCGSSWAKWNSRGKSSSEM